MTRTTQLLLSGLGIREVLSFWTGHPFDFEIWVRLGYYVSRGGDPYSSTQPIQGLSIPGTGVLPSIAYPPLWAFMQAVVYDLYSLIGYGNRFFYYFLIKQETIIPDIMVGYLIYKLIAQHGDLENAKKALAFWMFCPFVILISAVWGMFDQLTLLLVLAAVFLAENAFRSTIAESMGIFLKAIPVIFLPALAWEQDTASRKALFFVLAPVLAVCLTLAPYLYFHTWSLSALLGSGSYAVNAPANSLNYWVIAYVLYGYSLYPTSLNLFIYLMGYLWIPALAFGYVYILRGKANGGLSLSNLIMVLQFATLVFFLVRTSIAEQYVIYFLGFGLLERYLVDGSRSKFFHGVWISALGFLLANNTYLVRFLSPISIQFSELDATLSAGLLGEIRNGIMVATALAFTIFCLLYLLSLWTAINRGGHSSMAVTSQTSSAPLGLSD